MKGGKSRRERRSGVEEKAGKEEHTETKLRNMMVKKEIEKG